MTAIISNSGDASDIVRFTVRSDAPITADASRESLSVPAGSTQEIPIRITPLEPGSGSLTILATGQDGRTVRHDVPISIQAASPAPGAKIFVSVEPSWFTTEPGRESLVTLRLSNQGARTDTVTVHGSGDGVSLSPSEIEVTLAGGESAVRQVSALAESAGNTTLRFRVESVLGASLEPVSMMDTNTASAQSEAPAAPTGSSPGLGYVLALSAMVVAFAGVGLRRRR